MTGAGGEGIEVAVVNDVATSRCSDVVRSPPAVGSVRLEQGKQSLCRVVVVRGPCDKHEQWRG